MTERDFLLRALEESMNKGKWTLHYRYLKNPERIIDWKDNQGELLIKTDKLPNCWQSIEAFDRATYEEDLGSGV